MFARNWKIFHVKPSMCAYGLVKKEFSSQIVELVDKRICVLFFGGVTFIVGER